MLPIRARVTEPLQEMRPHNLIVFKFEVGSGKFPMT